MSYRTFTRTWWRENADYPDELEPEAGKRKYYHRYDTEKEAQEACKQYNATHNPGRLSMKMEYEEI